MEQRTPDNEMNGDSDAESNAPHVEYRSEADSIGRRGNQQAGPQKAARRKQGGSPPSRSQVIVFAILSVLGLITSILVGKYLFDQAPRNAEGVDIDRGYYLLLVILGLTSAAFLFGLMNSTATVRGSHLGLRYKVGGPAAFALLVVVGGFYLTQAPATFDLTIRLIGEFRPDTGGDTWLIVDTGPRHDHLPVDKLGDVTVKNLLTANERTPVIVSLESKSITLPDAGKQLKIPTNHILRLAVNRIVEATKDIISEQYVRLAGAVEVPIIVQLQTAGGPDCTDEYCQIGKQDGDQNTQTRGYDVQSGNISKDLAVFWKEQWPFRDALPLGLPLWRTVAGDGTIGLKLLGQVDRRSSECLGAALRPWEHNEEFFTTREDAKRLSQTIGYLFWVFENDSAFPAKNVKISFQQVGPSMDVGEYVKTAAGAPPPGTILSTQILPSLAAHQKIIVLLSAYRRAEDGFEATLLTDTLIPRYISYTYNTDDTEVSSIHTVRPPLREQAATIPLPFGWYEQ